jgi:AraC-like DNA-binding protein
MTNRSILDLSLDCGITNLGYFYRLFRKRFARIE